MGTTPLESRNGRAGRFRVQALSVVGLLVLHVFRPLEVTAVKRSLVVVKSDLTVGSTSSGHEFSRRGLNDAWDQTIYNYQQLAVAIKKKKNPTGGQPGGGGAGADKATNPPSPSPSRSPTPTISRAPSEAPTPRPSAAPTKSRPPSAAPTSPPTPAPSPRPSSPPTPAPSPSPSSPPTRTPSSSPSDTPSDTPSDSPSGFPTVSPAPTVSFAPTVALFVTTRSQDSSGDVMAMSTCNETVPTSAGQVVEQLIAFEYSLYLTPGANPVTKAQAIESEIHAPIAFALMDCNFTAKVGWSFDVVSVSSLPTDQLKETCPSVPTSKGELGLNCFTMNAYITAGIFYFGQANTTTNRTMTNNTRMLLATSISDYHVVQAIGPVLKAIFDSGKLEEYDSEVAAVEFKGFSNVGQSSTDGGSSTSGTTPPSNNAAGLESGASPDSSKAQRIAAGTVSVTLAAAALLAVVYAALRQRRRVIKYRERIALLDADNNGWNLEDMEVESEPSSKKEVKSRPPSRSSDRKVDVLNELEEFESSVEGSRDMEVPTWVRPATNGSGETVFVTTAMSPLPSQSSRSSSSYTKSLRNAGEPGSAVASLRSSKSNASAKKTTFVPTIAEMEPLQSGSAVSSKSKFGKIDDEEPSTAPTVALTLSLSTRMSSLQSGSYHHQADTVNL